MNPRDSYDRQFDIPYYFKILTFVTHLDSKIYSKMDLYRNVV